MTRPLATAPASARLEADHHPARPAERCLCEDCQSAPSPTAYLADLLSYVTSRLLDQGKQVWLPYLVENYHQPFADLPTDCAAVRDAGPAGQDLRGGAPRLPQVPGTRRPRPSRHCTDSCRPQYLLAAYQALLTGLGTSFDELRLARAANPATRSALAAGWA